ncbi:MAG: hypothetical protein PHQ72_14365 [Hespellia sp.]|nr:hypothetical protein [Hespellia sp.]
MELQKGYEVIRFIDQGNLCRISMDYMKGDLLLLWLKDNRTMEKEQLYQWIEMLTMQICLFHRCQKNQCYRYFSPESVLVTPEGQLYLLDLEAKSNAFVMRDMQRREMRRHFVKKELHFRQNMGLETDLYGLGKTIQFLLTYIRLDVAFTRKEERNLYRFIERCLGNPPRKAYQKLEQIQKEIPQYKKQNKNRNVMVILIFAVTLLAAAVIFVPKRWEKSSQRNVHEVETDRQNQAQEEKNQRDEIEKPAEQETETVDVLEQLQRRLQNNTAEDNRQIIEEGAEMEAELARCLATAYDREEEYEEALFYYQILIHLEENVQQLESFYLRKSTIEEQLTKKEAARATYKEAMERCPKNQKIALQYLAFICKSDNKDKEKQNQELQELLAGFPELKETEAFVKMQQEYGIKMEEEKIWIEKDNG